MVGTVSLSLSHLMWCLLPKVQASLLSSSLAPSSSRCQPNLPGSLRCVSHHMQDWISGGLGPCQVGLKGDVIMNLKSSLSGVGGNQDWKQE